MKDLRKTLRFAAYVFALPLVATAAVSGHQFFQNDKPVSVVTTPKAKTNEVPLVGLSDAFRQHTIAINENGQVAGRVWLVDPLSNTKSGLADTKVYFVRDGEIASQVYTDPDGTFDVSGLVTGAYSFVVSNLEGVAVYGVNVVENGAIGDMNVVVVSKNAHKAQQLLDRKNESTKSTKLTTEVVRGSNSAQLQDGSLVGQLHSTFQETDFTGSTVDVFNGSGHRIGSAGTDANGNFVVDGMVPGYYEFVATGPQGFAAFGFEAVDSKSAYTITQGFGFHAMVTSPVDSYSIGDCATCSSDALYGSPIDSFIGNPVVEYAGSCSSRAGSFSSCCGGGGHGGFGGGGFGGGGIGRLLGVAGLALGIAAIADDNPSDPGGATPVTN